MKALLVFHIIDTRVCLKGTKWSEVLLKQHNMLTSALRSTAKNHPDQPTNPLHGLQVIHLEVDLPRIHRDGMEIHILIRVVKSMIYADVSIHIPWHSMI